MLRTLKAEGTEGGGCSEPSSSSSNSSVDSILLASSSSLVLREDVNWVSYARERMPTGVISARETRIAISYHL